MRKYINLLSLCLSLTLKVSTYTVRNIKTNSLITLSKYPIEYSELVFVSIKFDQH